VKFPARNPISPVLKEQKLFSPNGSAFAQPHYTTNGMRAFLSILTFVPDGVSCAKKDEHKRCPNQTPEIAGDDATQAGMPALPGEIAFDDYDFDRDAALSRLPDDFLREHGFVSESAQADADSKED